MKAIQINNPGKNATLSIQNHNTPKPGVREILVRHKATALNRADLLQRRGLYDPPAGESPIPGLEMSGTVAETGPGVTRWKKGDEVFGLLPGGGYAEYSVLHEDLTMGKPPNLSCTEAAAIPETFLTAYQALYWLAELQEDEHILIHAGGSGVGTSAIQLARFKTPHIYVTAGKEHKIKKCIQLGAKTGIHYKKEDFAERIATLTNGQGVDIIIDFIGADYWKRNLESLARDGRLVMLALMGGDKVEKFSLIPFLANRLTVRASTLRSRSLEYKTGLIRAFLSDFYKKLAEGTIKPVIDSVYNWQETEEAHRRMSQNKNFGKIVLEID